MKTLDLLIFENGNGGEISLNGRDISLVERLYYKVYYSLFGGNIEATTKGNEVVGEVRSDWWGNSLFFSEKKAKQFNSETEKTLRNVTLNSLGRIEILNSVKNDLKYLKDISQLDINIVLLSTEKLEIIVKLKKLENSSNNALRIIWDNAKNQVISSIII